MHSPRIVKPLHLWHLKHGKPLLVCEYGLTNQDFIQCQSFIRFNSRGAETPPSVFYSTIPSSQLNAPRETEFCAVDVLLIVVLHQKHTENGKHFLRVWSNAI